MKEKEISFGNTLTMPILFWTLLLMVLLVVINWVCQLCLIYLFLKEVGIVDIKWIVMPLIGPALGLLFLLNNKYVCTGRELIIKQHESLLFHRTVYNIPFTSIERVSIYYPWHGWLKCLRLYVNGEELRILACSHTDELYEYIHHRISQNL